MKRGACTGKCVQIQANTKQTHNKYKQIQANANTYKPVQINTNKCKQKQANTNTYKQVKAKCKQIPA